MQLPTRQRTSVAAWTGFAVIKRDPKAQGSDATRLAKLEAEKAMDWLRKAVPARYKNAEHMKKDKDLEALREREDFQKLVAELDGKGD